MPADQDRRTSRGSQTLFFKHIIRKIFLEDWAMKLIALVITFGLWLGVTGLSTPTTKRFTVPLIPNISNSAEITSALIQEVDIVVSGDKRKVDQINRSDLSATLDLTDVAPGDRVVSLSPDNVSVALPQGVKLVEVQPGRIAVKLEAVEEREFDVRAPVDGAPAAGFEVYSTSVLPPKIRVRGPESFIKTLDFIETDKIDISGQQADFTARQVPVRVSNPKAAVLNTVVDVFFRIGEKRVERSFKVPVSNDNKDATFVVYGPKTVLQKTRPEEIKVEMVLGDSGEEEPQVNLPPNLRDVSEIRNIKIISKPPKP
jgi:YbbR domain-containing protein